MPNQDNHQLNVDLQPHQKRVLEKLRKHPALLLYHGLGSGKTLSSIAASEPYHNTNVVVPAALRQNYEKELDKFRANKKTRNIVSYDEAVRRPLNPADFLILDEAHRLGTSDSKRTQAIYREALKHKKRLLLTGTPIRNYPYELAPLSRILDPHSRALPLSESEFNKRFLTDEVIHHRGFDRVKELFGMLEPGHKPKAKNTRLIAQTFKDKVDYYQPEQADYPTINRTNVPVRMTPSQSDVYRTIIRKADPLIAAKVRANIPPSKKDLRRMNAFMTAARIVSNTTKPFGGTEVTPKVHKVVQDLDDMLKANPRHKGVIYSNYLEGGLNEVSAILTQKNIPHSMFTGKLKDSSRREIIQDFNNGKIPVLLVSASGTEGLDLKGGRSVQIMEPHWNKARLDQVIGRVVRHKSHAHLPEDERNVNVMYYQSTLPRTKIQSILNKPADTSADEYLYNISHSKDELNNQFLNILKHIGSQ